MKEPPVEPTLRHERRQSRRVVQVAVSQKHLSDGIGRHASFDEPGHHTIASIDQIVHTIDGEQRRGLRTPATRVWRAALRPEKRDRRCLLRASPDFS